MRPESRLGGTLELRAIQAWWPAPIPPGAVDPDNRLTDVVLTSHGGALPRRKRRLQAGRHDSARVARASPGPAAPARAGSEGDRTAALPGGPRLADRVPARARRPPPPARR